MDVDSAADIRRHLCVAVSDDQALVRPLRAHEVAGLENDIVTWRSDTRGAFQRVILAEQEHSTRAGRSGVLDLTENGTARTKIHCPVEDGCAGLFQAKLYLRSDTGAFAAVPEEDILPRGELTEPRIESLAEIRVLDPRWIRVRRDERDGLSPT